MLSLRRRRRLPRQTRQSASTCGLRLYKCPLPPKHPFLSHCLKQLFPSLGKGQGELQECQLNAFLTFHVRLCNSFLMEPTVKREYYTAIKVFGD